MTDEKKARISELTALARERELTAAEQAERQALRQEYLEEWRRGAAQVLDNTYVQGADGVKRKLGKK